MIEIDFVTGLRRRNFPRFAKKARLTHRLAVIQHTDVKGVDHRVIDEPLFEALIDFVSEYDPAATLFVVEKDWDDIGRKERPFSDLVAEWDKNTDEHRLMPAAFLLRKGGALRLCVLVENGYGPDANRPFTNSYTYSLLSDRDISGDVVAFLRDRKAASGWKLSPRIVKLEEVGRLPDINRRTRDNTKIPPRERGPFRAMVLGIMAFIGLGFTALYIRNEHEALVWGGGLAMASAILGACLFSDYRDSDVTLSWEGMRKGKGPRAKFIPWTQAKLSFKDNKVFVRSNGRTTSIRPDRFKALEFWIFFRVLHREGEERALKQFDEGEILRTPPYALSETDLKNFDRYWGPGAGTIRSVLSIAAMPLMVILLWYWRSPRRHDLPPILQNPLVFLVAAALCTVLLFGLLYLAFSLTVPGPKGRSAHEEFTITLGTVGFVASHADIRRLTFWYEVGWIVHSTKVILFFTASGRANIVPKRIFASPAEATAFLKKAIALKRACRE